MSGWAMETTVRCDRCGRFFVQKAKTKKDIIKLVVTYGGKENKYDVLNICGTCSNQIKDTIYGHR